jgi:hypothetical protein
MCKVKRGSLPLGSAESRAAVRAWAKRRESLPYHCSKCFLTGLVVMNSRRPEFIPDEDMEKGPDGWIWKCSKHPDPSKEATVRELIKSGLLGGSKA